MTTATDTPAAPVAAPEPPAAAVAIIPAPAVVRTGLRVLRPVAVPADLIAHQKQVREYIKQVLQKDRDYGVVPGTTKPTLLKPGAEAVTAGFGCVAVPRILEQQIDHFAPTPWSKKKKEWRTIDGKRQESWIVETGEALGLYRYVVAVDIVDQDGIVRGTGIGSCSTLESKYCDRPRDCENTVLKMARKRAHIAGVLDAFGLSDEFTQDVDERHVAAAVGVKGADSAPTGEGQPYAIPFGPSKGTAIQDMDLKDLKSAMKWASDKAKFKEFCAKAEAEIANRERAVAPAAAATAKAAGEAATPEAKAKAGLEEFPSALEPDDDDLPFD